jgi:hypothetical protein
MVMGPGDDGGDGGGDGTVVADSGLSHHAFLGNLGLDQGPKAVLEPIPPAIATEMYVVVVGMEEDVVEKMAADVLLKKAMGIGCWRVGRNDEIGEGRCQVGRP